jgi:hypothetical protein
VATDPSALSNFFPVPDDAGRRARSLVAPDRRIKRHLDGGEPLLARRTESLLTRVDDEGLEPTGVPGSVYLTDRRLIHLSGEARVNELAIDLGQVTELSLSGAHLLITVRPHRGFMLDVESPIDFRAQMALAISALRGR